MATESTTEELKVAEISEPLTPQLKPYEFVAPLIEDEEVKRVFSIPSPAAACRALRHHHANSLDYDKAELQRLAFHMFESQGLIEHFDLCPLTLKRLIATIAASYRECSFHNFYHAFMVTHMVYVMIETHGIKEILTKEDELSLLLCALMHDIDHPGLSNGFHVAAKTSLAHRYENQSPLENHHYHCSQVLLADDRLNVLKPLNEEQLAAVRGRMQALILATDMAKHFGIVASLKEKLEAKTFDLKVEEDRILALQLLLKCADISNEARPFDVSTPWANLLLKEFFSQAHTEKSMGMPVTPFMDPEKIVLEKCQVGFIDTFLIPSIELMEAVFPAVAPIGDAIRENRNRWFELSQQLESGDGEKKE